MMNMIVERTATGEPRFVHMSRSGRRYTGRTQEECERKKLLAIAHMHAKKIGEDIADELCAGMFNGVCSFGDLTLEQLRELIESFKGLNANIKQAEDVRRLEPLLTDKQRRQIIKLGVYVLGPIYGKDFTFRKVKEWLPQYRNADRVDIGKLTNREAAYLIKRFIRIEKRLEDA